MIQNKEEIKVVNNHYVAVAALSTVPNQTVCCGNFSYDTAVRFERGDPYQLFFQILSFCHF